MTSAYGHATMSITAAVLLLSAGATARITRFITADVLAEPFRLSVERRLGPDHRLVYLMTCPWCASIWVSAAVVSTAVFLGQTTAWMAATAALTISYLYGLVASHLD